MPDTRSLASSTIFKSVSGLRTTPTRTKRHAGSRSALPTVRSGSNTQAGGRYWEAFHVDLKAGDVVAIGIWNGAILTSGAGESGNGGAMTFRASITCPDGTRSETASVTIADNAVGEVLITLPTDFPAYRKGLVNWDMLMAGSGRVPSVTFSNSCDRGNGDQYLVGAAGYGHTQDSNVLGAGEASVWLPQYTAVMSDLRVRVAVGDSLTAGVNDCEFDPSGGKGLFGRALAPLGPYLNYGAPGDRATVAAAGFTARSALITAAGAGPACPFTGYLAMGRNDLSISRTVDQLLTDRTTLKGLMKAAGCGTVYDTTISPQTNSSDLYVTTANQTIAGQAIDTVRCNFNDFLRGIRNYGTTGTLANGSAVITLVTSMTLLGLYVGMTVTSGTAGIPANTTITAIDYTAGTVTMSAAFTGSTTAGATITATAPVVTTTTYAIDGVVDLTAPVEGAKTRPIGAVRNGGVFLPGMVSPDGTHHTSAGFLAGKSVIENHAKTRV